MIAGRFLKKMLLKKKNSLLLNIQIYLLLEIFRNIIIYNKERIKNNKTHYAR